MPTWVSEIRSKYGSLDRLKLVYSYTRMNVYAENTMESFRQDTPTLGRVEVTYGKGAAVSWLYDILQSTLAFQGVTDEKFTKEQVYDLAQTITIQYKTLKMSEFMVFLSRFKAGRYGRFYGDTSYALTIMEALGKFMVERTAFYDIIENEELDKKMKQEKEGAISYQEFKARMEAKGEKINLEDFFA